MTIFRMTSRWNILNGKPVTVFLRKSFCKNLSLHSFILLYEHYLFPLSLIDLHDIVMMIFPNLFDCTSSDSGSHLGLRLSSSSSRWAHGRNEDPIVYAEMNQMYEIVGIKLIRSNSTFSSGVFHSPLSSPPRFISNDSNEVENRNTNIDSKDRAKEDFYDNYDDDDDGDNNDDDNNDDDDYETAEKSPPFGSCTYNNLLIKDDNIMNKSFGSRSQSQSIDRMASIAGDAHLLRLQQVSYLPSRLK